MWIIRYCYKTVTRHKPVQTLNNSRYHSMLLCQEEWGPIDTEKNINKSFTSGFSSTDLELNIIIMLLVIFVNIAYLCISVNILREFCLNMGLVYAW